MDDPLGKQEAERISAKYEKCRWTELPIEVSRGKKEYKIKVVVLTNQESQTQGRGA